MWNSNSSYGLIGREILLIRVIVFWSVINFEDIQQVDETFNNIFVA